MLCCHLVGAADLPGGSFSRSNLPSSFGGLFIPQFPLILHVALVEGQHLAEPEMWDELVVSGPGGWYLGGARPGGEGSGFLGVASQPSLIWPLFPQKLARALPTLAASRNLVFVPELILRNSGNYQRPLPSPPFLPLPLFSVLWVCFSALLVCPT